MSEEKDDLTSLARRESQMDQVSLSKFFKDPENRAALNDFLARGAKPNFHCNVFEDLNRQCLQLQVCHVRECAACRESAELFNQIIHRRSDLNSSQ